MILLLRTSLLFTFLFIGGIFLFPVNLHAQSEGGSFYQQVQHSKKYKRKTRRAAKYVNILSNLSFELQSHQKFDAQFLATLRFKTNEHGTVFVNVLNQKGCIRHSETFRAKAGNNMILIDIADWDIGNYRILVTQGDLYLSAGFVKG